MGLLLFVVLEIGKESGFELEAHQPLEEHVVY